jgi:hypothetical protein
MDLKQGDHDSTQKMGMKHDRILVSVCDANGVRKIIRMKRRLFDSAYAKRVKRPVFPPKSSDSLTAVEDIPCAAGDSTRRARKAVVISRCTSKSIPREAIIPTDPKARTVVTDLTINDSQELEMLPESIGELPNLQYLNISGLRNLKRPIPLSLEQCRKLKKIWAIDTPLETAFPCMMTLLLPSEPQVVTTYGISNNEWPTLYQHAIDQLDKAVATQLGDDYEVYPYLKQMIDEMRSAAQAVN